MKFWLILSLLILTMSCEKPKDWLCTCDLVVAPYGNIHSTKSILNTKQTQAGRECDAYGKEMAEKGTLIGEINCEINIK